MSLKHFTIGEPDGTRSERVKTLSDALTGANFKAPIRDQIRWNVWLKLWGNVCFNPIGASLDPRHLGPDHHPAGIAQLCKQMMHEAKAVVSRGAWASTFPKI